MWPLNIVTRSGNSIDRLPIIGRPGIWSPNNISSMEDLYIYTWERFSLWELRSDQLQFFFFFRSKISMWIVFREREGNVPRSRFLERANIREITFDFFFEEGKKRAKIEIRWTESVFYLAKAKRDRMKKGKRERKERWIERVRPPSPMIEFASSGGDGIICC